MSLTKETYGDYFSALNIQKFTVSDCHIEFGGSRIEIKGNLDFRYELYSTLWVVSYLIPLSGPLNKAQGISCKSLT